MFVGIDFEGIFSEGLLTEGLLSDSRFFYVNFSGFLWRLRAWQRNMLRPFAIWPAKNTNWLFLESLTLELSYQKDIFEKLLKMSPFFGQNSAKKH